MTELEETTEVNKLDIPIWKLFVGFCLAIIVSVSFFALLYLLAHPLAVIILSVALAAALAPLVQWFERWFSRTGSVVLVYAIILTPILLLLSFTLPQLGVQIQQTAERLPDWVNQLQVWARQWGVPLRMASNIDDTMLEQIEQFGGRFAALPITVASTSLEFLLGGILSAYMLIEAPNLSNFCFSILPQQYHKSVLGIVSEMLETMGGFIRGSAITALTIGVTTYIGLTLIGIEFALSLAIFAGIMEVFPVVGPIISTIPILFFALLQSPTKFLFAAIFMLILQQVEGNWLVPQVMHKQVKVSPLVVLIALYIGGSVGGLLGAFVAIPLAAAARVLFMSLVVPALRDASQKVV